MAAIEAAIQKNTWHFGVMTGWPGQAHDCPVRSTSSNRSPFNVTPETPEALSGVFLNTSVSGLQDPG
jgi:hypothetical protein